MRRVIVHRAGIWGTWTSPRAACGQYNATMLTRDPNAVTCYRCAPVHPRSYTAAPFPDLIERRARRLAEMERA